MVKFPFGPPFRLVCCDSDHDSLPELVFSTWPSYSRRLIEFWEHQGWNRFGLVHSDTGTFWPGTPGIITGNVIPSEAGDIDGDGLTDLLCFVDERDSSDPNVLHNDVLVLESPDEFSYPSSVVWYCRCNNNGNSWVFNHIPPDLDKDGRREIVHSPGWIRTRIWESVGNDSYELVSRDSIINPWVTFGDFLMNGHECIAATDGSSVQVWECTGDNQYERVWQEACPLPNGRDAFMTDDIDRDGLPEFYVTCFDPWWIYRAWLFMYEYDRAADKQFVRTLVDSFPYPNPRDPEGLLFFGGGGIGGDIDGDGIDECIWSDYDSVRVYKAVRDNQLVGVWQWQNDHFPPGLDWLGATVYDVNSDGYNELLLTGNNQISILEINGVDLLSPNGGSCMVGDTIPIRWVTYHPPRCDSLSLFLRRDSLWHFTTIATGLPGTDTSYRWVVPAGVPETARVVVIAYGPGWQFDMSDSAISFIGGAVAEESRNVPLRWSLSVSPNPASGTFTVRYDVPGGTGHDPNSSTELGHVPVALGIYDAGGRLVRFLSEGEVSPGRYEARLPSGALPAGVYFCTLDAGTSRISQKVVVSR